MATSRQTYEDIDEAVAIGIAKRTGEIRNPNRPGNFVQTIELVEELGLVRCVLENIKVPSDASPDTQSN